MLLTQDHGRSNEESNFTMEDLDQLKSVEETYFKTRDGGRR